MAKDCNMARVEVMIDRVEIVIATRSIRTFNMAGDFDMAGDLTMVRVEVMIPRGEILIVTRS